MRVFENQKLDASVFPLWRNFGEMEEFREWVVRSIRSACTPPHPMDFLNSTKKHATAFVDLLSTLKLSSEMDRSTIFKTRYNASSLTDTGFLKEGS